MSIFNWNQTGNTNMANNPEGEHAMITNTNSIPLNEPHIDSAEVVATIERSAVNNDFAERIVQGLESLPLTGVPQKTVDVAMPAGDYLATITDAHLKYQAQGAYHLVIVNMTVAAGGYKGFSLTKYYHLKSQKAVDFFKKEMLSIGFVVESDEKLGSLCSSLAKTSAMVTVAFNESGNRILYLKAAAAPKKIAQVKTQFTW